MWEPVVLTHLDAKRNPLYGDFIKAFDNNNTTEHLNIYNQHCYFRWLAMGASGGGYMSDFDTFPLHSDQVYYGDHLPYGGKFTSYGGVCIFYMICVCAHKSAIVSFHSYRLYRTCYQDQKKNGIE